ncbi:acetyl-CoA carboxylase, carboxyl transferase, alpha subunit [Lentisphaera araneosa HTCC2155]|uniref:Acetyl-coenzyme A carboxylase carboxyl transferase subunit alpha n=1 Tax=Lentisphaera araneosa HTCC2155 TaxID=313628 RepID=A6DPJ5_9BACT|nr:acetyl-CoA carboxylase carboxyltransferase subunit alpha [Lentisphaera araneosa]EDM26491.1 acetyl-CoA carboxylase, carboxyl transferase, alpha subunit [Lentisphaera araneosa HTCC2155]
MENFVLEFEKPIIELKEKLSEIQEFGETNNIDMSKQIAELESQITSKSTEIFGSLTPWQRVQVARHPQRPYALDYLNIFASDFVELKGDRRFGNDEAIIGGFAKLRDGRKVMVIAQQKGRDLKERSLRNFGMAHPEGYRKALRLMQLADKVGCPIITIIDTPGAYPGIASEERHVGEAIAVNLLEMFKLRVPIISVVIGEGGSGGALGIGVANKVFIMENAYYSVISPEGCAGIIWKDGAKAPEAAAAMKISAGELLKLKVVDDIVKEPLGGAHKDHEVAGNALYEMISKELNDLSELSEQEILDQRYDRFREIGSFLEN